MLFRTARARWSVTVSVLFFVFMTGAILTYAALPYAPGQTLDPTCHPGDANCTVSQTVYWSPTSTGIYYNASGTVSVGTTLPTVLGPTGYVTVTDASPIAWSMAGQSVKNGIVTLAHGTATRALNVSNLLSGGFYTLIVKQDSTGGAAMTGGTGCAWLTPGGLGTGTFPIATGVSAISVISFTYDGANCLMVPAAGYSAM